MHFIILKSTDFEKKGFYLKGEAAYCLINMTTPNVNA